MMVISKIGCQIALQVEIHSSLELATLVLVAHTQVLASLARDLLREELLLNTMVTTRLGLNHATQLRIPLLRRIQAVLVRALSKMSVSNAWDSLRRDLLLNTMVIPKNGLSHVIQPRTLLPRRTQVVLVRALSQVSALSAWDSLRRNLLLNTMVTTRLGLSHVTQLRIPLLRRIQVVLVKALSQVSVSNAWDSLRENLEDLLLNTMVTTRLGLSHATQLRIPLLRRIQVVLVKALSQVSVSNAWDSLRENQQDLLLSTMVIPKIGFPSAIQLKIPLPRRTQVALELILMKRKEDLSQELELIAKVLPKENLLHSIMVTLRIGLSHAMHLKTPLLRKIQAELELIMDQRLRDLSQVLELIAWDSLKENLADLLLNTMVIAKIGLRHATQLRIPLLRRIQAVLELIRKILKDPSQVSVSIAWDSLRKNLLLNTMVIAKIG